MSKTCKRCGNIATNILFDIDVCTTCYNRLKSEYKIEKITGIKKVEQGTRLILEGLRDTFGLDITDENFIDTPKRVSRAYYELCLGINCQEELDAILSTSFPSTYDGMIVSKNIRCYSLCPHHLLPVEYHIDIGYIPKDRAIGISKIPRIVELLAKAPKLQEQLTSDIANALERIECKGVIVQVRGKHLCMGARGIRQPDVDTLTSSIRGVFEGQPVRNEFQLLINNSE